jgi:hypothetical protein
MGCTIACFLLLQSVKYASVENEMVGLLPLSFAATAARAASPAMRSSHAASLTTASCCRACAQGKKDERYCFVVDWFDPQASLVRKYQLIYYSADGTIEMVRSCARTLQILGPMALRSGCERANPVGSRATQLCAGSAAMLPAACCLYMRALVPRSRTLGAACPRLTLARAALSSPLGSST